MIIDEELKTTMTKRSWVPAIALAVLSLALVACGQAPASTDPFAKNDDGYAALRSLWGTPTVCLPLELQCPV
jgi:hypothetical protein